MKLYSKSCRWWVAVISTVLLTEISNIAGATNLSDPLTYDPQYGANETNIVYGKAGGQKLLLDAHVPDGDGLHPIVIIVHGDGWISGDRRHEISEMFEPLTRSNFTWFSIEYRLAPTNRWPACFDDVERAVRWVKSHGKEFKGDSKRIAIIGYSAGGHLVTFAGTHPEHGARVDAVVGLAPPTDLVSDNERRGGLTISMRDLFNFPTTNISDHVRVILKKNSPLTYVKPGLPPFLLVQGNRDRTVPHTQSEAFQAALLAKGDACDFITITNAQHRIRDWDKFDLQWQGQVISWLEQKMPPTK